MKFLSIIVVSVFFFGCKYDSGSSSLAKGFGKSIPLECFKSNLKGVKGLAVSSETENSIILSSPGITSTIEFEVKGSVVKSYSVYTKTEKSSNKDVHSLVETAVEKSCSQ